jgi:imidazole glycerol-phosphate synthase subunit HisF
MSYPRIIARLDIKGPNLVKGIHLEGLRVLGSPYEFAKKYVEDGADELFYQDVVASLYGRNSILDFIKETAKIISIPLTVGGGIRKINDINDVLKAGADKVAINTAAIKNPSIIKEASRIFGSSTIVASIETIKNKEGEYLAYTDNGREHTGINIVEWSKQLEELGVGEIVITSIDQEGTGNGFDVTLLKKIRSIVSIPVIAHGGFGNYNHIIKAITEGGANGVALSSMIHYGALFNNEFINNEIAEGNRSFVSNLRQYKSFGAMDIRKIKNDLKDQVNIRI